MAISSDGRYIACGTNTGQFTVILYTYIHIHLYYIFILYTYLCVQIQTYMNTGHLYIHDVWADTIKAHEAQLLREQQQQQGKGIGGKQGKGNKYQYMMICRSVIKSIIYQRYV